MLCKLGRTGALVMSNQQNRSKKRRCLRLILPTFSILQGLYTVLAPKTWTNASVSSTTNLRPPSVFVILWMGGETLSNDGKVTIGFWTCLANISTDGQKCNGFSSLDLIPCIYSSLNGLKRGQDTFYSQRSLRPTSTRDVQDLQVQDTSRHVQHMASGSTQTQHPV